MDINLQKMALNICKDYNFNFMGKVGEGSYKETFKVVSEKNEVLALKIFKKGNSVERTSREIDAMIRCNHPNIGKIMYVSEYISCDKKYLFSIEEFLSGGNLQQYISKNGLLPRKELIRMGKTLIDAIGHIASKNLVHRDIKPENVMFRKDKKTPVIVDFGLVRDLNKKSLTQTWLMQGPGTPYFAAPEQLNNEKNLIDWRTDQFALGVLFSLCYFGIHPYEHPEDGMGDVVNRIASRDSIYEIFIKKAKEEGLAPLIKMVKPWPVQRFRNVKELAYVWNELY